MLQHHCLRLDIYPTEADSNRRMLWYCMSELPSKLNDSTDDQQERFTFVQLSQHNITSQDLYRWSAPIDIAENYQFYLNQLLLSINDTILANEYFYNCTEQQFGPKCQYKFYNQFFPSFSVLETISDLYRYQYNYNPIDFTCYKHLKCDRGILPTCLDWSEICDGKIDCHDGGHDEEHCWELEINECVENEYRCKNGQCILQLDPIDEDGYGCLDPWILKRNDLSYSRYCSTNAIPSINCEDIRCRNGPLTSSCIPTRTDMLQTIIFSKKDLSVTPNCSSAFQYLFEDDIQICLLYPETCEFNQNNEIVNNACPSMMIYPNTSLSVDLIFVYSKTLSSNLRDMLIKTPLICYTKDHYNKYFSHFSKTYFQNMTCIDSEYFINQSGIILSQQLYPNLAIANYLHSILQKYHLNFNYTSTLCNQSNLYQCINSSKCISIYRLLDRTYDCPYLDDENINLLNYTKLSERSKTTYFKCQLSNKYIHHSKVKNTECDCDLDKNGLCEDEDLEGNYKETDLLFPKICDRLPDIFTVYFDGQNLTDETECEQWECNNIYTRCNKIQNCPNGIDEIGCDFLPYLLNCSSNHFLCVSPLNNQLICLPSERINNGNIDCLGALDEVALCETITRKSVQYKFYCQHNSSYSCIDDANLCDEEPQCEDRSDEQFCLKIDRFLSNEGICKAYVGADEMSDIERFICEYHGVKVRMTYNFFIDRIVDSFSFDIQTKNEEKKTRTLSKSISQTFEQDRYPCHRGIILRVSSNHSNESFTQTCLCPPMYYGNRCQYQNQRVSLTMKFRTLSDSWQTLFAIVILLIDNSDQRVIHSYEQFSYSSLANCKTKYDFYLNYATRPKDPLKNYSIHVDIYEKMTLNYRGSSLFPIHFGFLPVHRLTFLVDIPRTNDKIQSCSDNNCIHGKCITYNNYPYNQTFCQCDKNWSGKYCTISHNCTCSSNSTCIGLTANNRSICMCRVNQFGSRCLLNSSSCLFDGNSTCKHNSQCIASYDYDVYRSRYYCICPKGFNGEQCENHDGKLILSFGKDVAVSQSVLIHFIDIPMDMTHKILPYKRATTVGTIINKQNPLIIFWSQPFLMIFTEFIGKTYYLTHMQKSTNRSININTTITSSNRCPPINELFNETFLQWHLLRRIKYYHQPCQNQLFNLSCFYDEAHFCLCYSFEGKRLANCFHFDHNLKYDCYGNNECEHESLCYQDSKECPKRSVCQCKQCSFGRRCQFVTDSFGLSLDAILAYYISSHLTIIQQSAIIQFSLAFTIIFIVVGLIDSFLSFITFKSTVVQDVGCGIYLLCSSINNMITIIIFGLKFFILLFAQMTIISNRSFLAIQCHSLDFLLRTCLYMNQWLNACIAAERTITIIKEIYFDKKKSKQLARWIIVLFLLIIIGTSVHDPLYRRLIDEKNDDDNDEITRIWCVVTYSSTILQKYNLFVHGFHFFVPFIINIISSIILITTKSRQQTRIQRNESYKQIFQRQIQEYKHLLIAPIILVILGLPRLILLFISKCMESIDDAWIFLILYFISFIPSMLNFIVFILPSEFYKNEFRKSIGEYRKLFQCCSNRES